MIEGSPEFLVAVSRAGGALALLFGLLALAAAVRSAAIFRDESRKIDQLVAEYVRCRDYLLGNRKPSAASGWRTVENDALREAWRNFNIQIEAIRDRHERRARGPKAMIVAATIMVAATAALTLVVPSRDITSPADYLYAAAAGLSWLTAPFAAWLAARSLGAAIVERTTGNALISPWPSDGGAPERAFAAYDKFLPVEMDREGTGAAPGAP